MKKWIALLLVCLMTLPTFAFAEETAIEETEEVAETIDAYILIAEQGDAEAQYTLGLMYETGDGVEQDYVQAAQWYQQAVNQEHAEAEYRLGILYMNGYGVEKDSTYGLELYSLAAEHGNLDAKYSFASYCCTVFMLQAIFDDSYVSTAQDSFLLLVETADEGHPDAQYLVGFYLKEGFSIIGLEQDYEAAIVCFNLAVEQGHAGAMYQLGEMYQEGLGVAIDLAEALTLYLDAAELGSSNAQYALGTMYETGEGVEQDLAEAIMWYELAAAQENEKAQEKLDELQN